eukprot:2032896-Prymnesium_polylepis.1
MEPHLLHGLSECSCLREEKRRERRKIQKKEHSRRKRATIKGDWLQINKKCDPEAWVLYADLLDQTPANAVYTDELYRRHDRGDIIEKIVFQYFERHGEKVSIPKSTGRNYLPYDMNINGELTEIKSAAFS